ncbi:MAG TPA: alkaline phosphatase family protein [Verrucomicrobiales bacterium]|nr:alkaline phosphatase family protein [Verrucomicrobiales bacterium]
MKSLDLFVFVDALGWEIVSRRPFLRDILPRQSRCETVFGYSSACDPTILTGAPPVEHGHFSCFVKAQGKSPFAGMRGWGWAPQRIAGHHRLRHHLSRLVARRHGFTGYFQLYSVPFRCLPYLDYTEKWDIYEPNGILGGQETVFAAWERSGRPWMRSDWRKGDRENIAEVRAVIGEGEVELIYLFTAGPDAAMHRYGVDAPESRALIEKLEGSIRELWEEAKRRYGRVRISVFSDHGMCDTRSGSDLFRRWATLGLRYGRDYVAVWDSTMARFWFGAEEVRRQALGWLHDQPDGAVVDDASLARWGCLFPDRRYGEVFYLLPAGSLFVPSFMNQSWVKAMHGYDPDHPDSAAAWLTNAEGLPVPRSLGEIAGVMRAAAGGT